MAETPLFADGSVTLRFLAAPTDVAFLNGNIQGGKVLEWIDKAGFACAVGWSKQYCVTAYVGDVVFVRPIEVGHLVEVSAQIVHTGRTSMHIRVVVRSADPKVGAFSQSTECLMVFVSVGDGGRPAPVRAWEPATARALELQQTALGRIEVRRHIEEAMSRQTYSDEGTAPKITLRFMANPTDVNWGGKAHGGYVMAWIDEAAYLVAARWSAGMATAVYSGGIRFYRPILIGHLVEVEARLLHTGRTSMHISVHVRSGDPRDGVMSLTTHCLTVFVALDDVARPRPIPSWEPVSAEDVRLEAHARELVALREGRGPAADV
jgi:4-hydroxybenzoyl-CoA thioesterase